ncbi:COX15/CtaA family protein [Alicyclobacillus shizuokensis]|uniref:COX15/CtaA family protein n=1 Tax=Alicyclobacillus shizuokensis TaxID=392014 RepID=UPI00082C552D|nr:COX15/CtaA family protein [Alicyclobacillus shizuokensis]MCL6625079.1 COX15/CtaA family protein [Alicyclobacillus shizuokensis]
MSMQAIKPTSDGAAKPRQGRLFGLSLTTLIVLFVANVIGFTDTATGSVYGCGHDWPLCKGQLIPSVWSEHTAIEYAHRVSVFTMEILLLVTIICAWRWYGRHRWVRISIAWMVLGVVLESILGALAVFAINPPALMATHMGIALLALGGVTVMTVGSWRTERGQGWRPELAHKVAHGRDDASLGRTLYLWSWFALAFSYVAIYVGSYVASTGDGASFRGWPLPMESYHTMPHVFVIDVMHRGLALGLLLVTIRLAILGYRFRTVSRGICCFTVLSVALICLQAFSGAWLIFSHLSLPAFLTHVSFSSLLFADLCALTALGANYRIMVPAHGGEPQVLPLFPGRSRS